MEFNLGFSVPDDEITEQIVREEIMERIVFAGDEINNAANNIRGIVRRDLAQAQTCQLMIENNVCKKIRFALDQVRELIQPVEHKIKNRISNQVNAALEAVPTGEIFKPLRDTLFGGPLPTSPIADPPIIDPPVPPTDPPIIDPPSPPPEPPPAVNCPEDFGPAEDVIPSDWPHWPSVPPGSCARNIGRTQCPDGTFREIFDVLIWNASAGQFISVVMGGSCDPVPPPPPPPPPEPPEPPLPPDPPPEEPCIRLCPPDEPEEPECPEECPEECCDDCPTPPMHVWINCETGMLMVLPEDEEPEEPDDWEDQGEDPELADLCAACDDDEEEPEDRVPDHPMADFTSRTACDFLKRVPFTNPQKPIEEIKVDWSAFLDCITKFEPTDIKDFFNDPLKAFGGIIGHLLNCGIESQTTTVQRMFADTDCNNPEWIALQASRFVLGAFGILFPEVVKDLDVPLQNQSHFMCPLDVPSLGETNAAFLSNAIGEDVWNCWVRAKNQEGKNYARVLDAQRSKLNVAEVTALWRRKELTDQEYRTRIRQLGYLHGSEVEEFKELSIALPELDDLLRMMVRDVTDPNIVNRFRLDQDFDVKWSGRLKEMGEAQGIEEEFARFAWRAHWIIPAPNQLFDMLHRSESLPEGHLGKVTNDDVRAALKQQDIPEFWIDKFEVIAFNPLTRVDTRRAERIGILDKSEVKRSYLDQGYNHTNADILTDFTIQDNLIGWLKNPLVKQFARGEFTPGEFDQLMRQEGATTEIISHATQRAEILSNQETRKVCLGSLKKRFLTGEFTVDEVLPEVLSLTLSEPFSEQTVKKWSCELEARGKQGSASILCTWFMNGTITPDDFFGRLVKLGWEPKDAERILNDCLIRLRTKLRKEEEKRLRDKKRELKAKEKAKEKSIKQKIAEERRMKTAREKHHKNRKARNRILLNAALRVSTIINEDLADTLERVQDLFNTLRGMFLSTQDELVISIETASKDSKWETFDEFANIATQLVATDAIDSPATGTPDEANI